MLSDILRLWKKGYDFVSYYNESFNIWQKVLLEGPGEVMYNHDVAPIFDYYHVCDEELWFEIPDALW